MWPLLRAVDALGVLPRRPWFLAPSWQTDSLSSLSNIKHFAYSFLFNFRRAHMQQSVERSHIIWQFEIKSFLFPTSAYAAVGLYAVLFHPMWPLLRAAAALGVRSRRPLFLAPSWQTDSLSSLSNIKHFAYSF